MIAQLQTPFDLSQPASQVLAVVLFLIPGLNVTWIVERLAGRNPLSGTERLFRAIAWSVFLYAAASPWLVRLGHLAGGRRRMWVWEPIIGLSLIEFLAPVLLGLAIVGIRRMERFRSFMRRLTPIQSRWSSWDVAFSSQQQYFFVRAKLRSGKRVGGVFGQRSFASAYPEPQDLFLEQAWELAEDGSLLGRVPGSRGLFLRREDVEVLEFMAMEVGDAQEQSR